MSIFAYCEGHKNAKDCKDCQRRKEPPKSVDFCIMLVHKLEDDELCNYKIKLNEVAEWSQ